MNKESFGQNETASQYLLGIDGDDTLWYTEIVYESIYNKLKVESQLAFEWNDNAFQSMLMSNITIMGYGIKTYSVTLIEYILSKTKNSDDLIRLVIELFKQTWGGDIQLYENAMLFMERLNTFQPTVLVTQGDSYEQRSKIERSGMRFSDIEILPRKNEQSYMELIRKRGYSPEKFIMIGNSFKSDVIPVINIGSKAIYVKSKWQFEIVDDSMIHPNLYRSDNLLNSIELLNQIVY